MKLIDCSCPKCGAQVSIEEGREKVFCSFCGTAILLDKPAAQIYIHAENITYVDLDKKIKTAEMKAKAKDFDALKNLANEIQEMDSKNFYGWYYAALAVKENPLEGTAGKFVKGLNKFASNLAFMAKSGQDKKKEQFDKLAVANSAITALDNEMFCGYCFEALECISEEEQERNHQFNLFFGYITELTTTIWEGFSNSMYSAFGNVTNRMVASRDAKIVLNFLTKFIDKCKSLGYDSLNQYKECMAKHYNAFRHCTKRLGYKLYFVGKITKQIKSLLLPFQSNEFSNSATQNQTHPLWKKILIGILCLYPLVGLILYFGYKKEKPAEAKLYGGISLGATIMLFVLAIILMFI